MENYVNCWKVLNYQSSIIPIILFKEESNMPTVIELVSREFSRAKCIHIYRLKDDGSYSLAYTFAVGEKNKTILDVIYKYLSDFPTARRVLTILPVTDYVEDKGEVKITVGSRELIDMFNDMDNCDCCCGDIETTHEPMTVGKLKKLLANYPDETHVHIMTNIKEEGFTTQAITGMITMSDEDPMTIAFMSLENDNDDEYEYSFAYDGPCGSGGIDHDNEDCEG